MSEPSSFLEVAGKLSLALALVAFNGFFVAAEFALVKIRDTQLEGYIQRRHRRAGMVRHILSHLDGYLSACQLGITLASLALGWVAEPVFAALWSRSSDGSGLSRNGCATCSRPRWASWW